MNTFSVKNFERFQHYKDRSPPWIKLYNELLDDYEFGMLPDASKFHLIAIWLLASRSENKIPFDPKWVARRINADGAVNLVLLADSGFIVVDQQVQIAEQSASTPQAERLSRERGTSLEETDGGGMGRASDPPPARPKALISPEAFDLAHDVLVAMGFDPGHPISVGAPYTVQAWFNGGWPREAILTGVKLAMQHRSGDPPSTLRYFEKAIARQHAELTRTLPKVELVEGKPIQVTIHGKPKSAIIQAADDLCRKLASFDGPPREPDELRGGAGEAPPRLLSHG